MDRPLTLPWWHRRGWQRSLGIAGALLLAVLAAVLLLGPAERSMRMARAGLDIATVEQGVYHDFIPLRGEVVPHDTVFVDAQEGGLVNRVLVQAGDRVRAGEPLVGFSNTALELEVQSGENGLVQSITSLQKLETDLELTRANNERLLADGEDDVTRLQRELQRREELVQKHVVSVEERDQYRDQLASAVRKRDMQRDSNARQEALRVQQQPQIRQQITMLQESMKITHDKLRNLTARAPVGGLVTAMNLTVGQNRNRGERLAEITPDTGFKLSATVDEYYLGRVRDGQVGSVDKGEQAVAFESDARVSAGEGRRFRGGSGLRRRHAGRTAARPVPAGSPVTGRGPAGAGAGERRLSRAQWRRLGVRARRRRRQCAPTPREAWSAQCRAGRGAGRTCRRRARHRIRLHRARAHRSHRSEVNA